MYEAQGYRIPLPESEELQVPEPHGVDIAAVPAEFLREENLTEEAAIEYSRQKAGVAAREGGLSQDTGSGEESRFEEITEVD